MALVEFKLLPGIDKQQTQVGADKRWVNCDNVRFRYGLPEKVGGWSSLVTDTIVGVARAQYSFVDLEGNRYVAIGTDKFLLINSCSLCSKPPTKIILESIKDFLTSSLPILPRQPAIPILINFIITPYTFE